MFSPFVVRAYSDKGVLLEEKHVSDSHELQDVLKEFADKYPGACIEYEEDLI